MASKTQWVLSSLGTREIVVRSWRDAPPADGTVVPSGLVAGMLPGWLAAPFERAMLLDICRQLSRTIARHTTRWTTDDADRLVVAALCDALERGEIVAYERERPWLATEQLAPEPTERATKAQDKTFIEIKLVDESGAAVVGERYEVTLPSGRVRHGALDQDGFARIDRIDEGTCDVTFPNLDGRRWDLC